MIRSVGQFRQVFLGYGMMTYAAYACFTLMGIKPFRRELLVKTAYG